ncbi:MAG: site-specific integrase [Anaerolineales bacterium]|nr:site-specific integrase [Anaerolineales bacterium]
MTDLTTTPQAQLIQRQAIGRKANEFASNAVFVSYQLDKSKNTLARHGRDLDKFAECLTEVGAAVTGDSLMSDPQAWQGITWGMVDMFKKWLFNKGYALSTVNGCLSTVRIYAELAFNAGMIDQSDYLRIKAIKNIKQRADEKRSVSRVGDKKATAVILYERDAKLLIAEAYSKPTPAAMRDAAIMCLLLDHGLRASEVAALTVGCIDLENETLTFERPKVKGTQHETGRHILTPRSLYHLKAYMEFAPSFAHEPLFRTSDKSGSLGDGSLTRITVSRLVNRIATRAAEKHGLNKLTSLSAHDCRHYCATTMANKNYGVHELMNWFGWTSAQTAMRYVEAAEVAERDKG